MYRVMQVVIFVQIDIGHHFLPPSFLYSLVRTFPVLRFLIYLFFPTSGSGKPRGLNTPNLGGRFLE
jgi:hypothetical protein